MAIENRNLEPGTKLIAKYKKEEYRAEVVAGDEGKVKYRLTDGREFKSPSAAGTAITSKACNGWAFWSVDPGDPPGEPEEPETQESQSEDSAGPEAEEPPSSAGFRRVPNQRGVGEEVFIIHISFSILTSQISCAAFWRQLHLPCYAFLLSGSRSGNSLIMGSMIL